MTISAINLKGNKTVAITNPLDRHIAIYGDSRTANCHSTVAAGEVVENYGYAAWLSLYTESRVRTTKARNGGVGGDTTAQWLTRLPTVLAYGAKVVVNLISTNDRGAGLSLEVTKTNIDACIRAQLEAGIIPIIVAETPRGAGNALTGTNLANHLAVRDWIKSYFPSIGVRVADPWPDLISSDPTEAAAGLPKAGLFHDGLHPSPDGARIIGRHIAAQLIDLFPAKLLLPVFASPYDATTNKYGQLTTNPLCTGTAGTPTGSANATGQLADGWTCSGSSWTGGSVVLSKEANPSGGEYQVFTLGGTPTATGSTLVFSQSITLANVASGNKIKAVAKIAHADLVGVAGVALEIRFIRGGTTYYAKHNDRYTEATPISGDSFVAAFESPILTLDGTETSIEARVVVFGCQNIPLGGVVKVGQMAAVKVV